MIALSQPATRMHRRHCIGRFRKPSQLAPQARFFSRRSNKRKQNMSAPSRDETIAVPEPEPESDAPKRPERTPQFSDYIRVFGYATKWDFVIYAAASIASIGAGVTLPLMNVIFGQLVNDFAKFFQADVAMTPKTYMPSSTGKPYTSWRSSSGVGP
ncbi:unnamed protein product [Parascedosporium putredinis]|uniref:Uncharacterized protein n=1 Tax=Parascedosporium putredinis TaxID=1442378 RepID=A0A9P1H5Y8_9PEZI|nr:unnamed protein product [Parascedosporium putredinis]CAI7996879.1 unnamed protein product [Parascedosporium putredinis]